jgi:hypothetical protein
VKSRLYLGSALDRRNRRKQEEPGWITGGVDGVRTGTSEQKSTVSPLELTFPIRILISYVLLNLQKGVIKLRKAKIQATASRQDRGRPMELLHAASDCCCL